MSTHYNRINVFGWIFVAVGVFLFVIYAGFSFKDPGHEAMVLMLEEEKRHFSGWRLGMGPLNQVDIDRGLLFDNYERTFCTTRDYPKCAPCPPQQYYVNGVPSHPPIEAPPEPPRKSPVKK